MPKSKKEMTKAEKALATLREKAKGQANGATEAQKKEMATLRETVAGERFVAVANVRIPKALAAIESLANLGAKSYRSTEAQRKAIVEALEQRIKMVEGALSGVVSKTAFKLPE